MNPKSDVSVKKSALTPALSPWEREKRFPCLCKVQALDLRWFRGSMREILIRGNLSPLGWGDGVENSVEMRACGR